MADRRRHLGGIHERSDGRVMYHVVWALAADDDESAEGGACRDEVRGGRWHQQLAVPERVHGISEDGLRHHRAEAALASGAPIGTVADQLEAEVLLDEMCNGNVDLYRVSDMVHENRHLGELRARAESCPLYAWQLAHIQGEDGLGDRRRVHPARRRLAARGGRSVAKPNRLEPLMGSGSAPMPRRHQARALLNVCALLNVVAHGL
mmetsp:Transcript_109690/g.310309  ORF Transcript_109690/g.310309 Transcript_109690/m.310309 type:complete len:206 (-) Transcript_109690:893-1510(-)